MRSARPGLVPLSLLLALAGCRCGDPTDGPEDEPALTQEDEGEAGIVDRPAVAIEVIEVGDAPRRQLGLEAEVGSVQEMVLQARGRVVAQGADEPPAEDAIPDGAVLAELRLVDIGADGGRRYDVVIASVPTSAAAAGLAEGQLVVDERGVLRSFEIHPTGADEDASAPDATRPGLSALLDRGAPDPGTLTGPVGIAPSQDSGPGDPALRPSVTAELLFDIPGYLVAFPDEAVGPGARWRTTTRMAHQGMRVERQVEYRLVALDERSAVLDARATQRLDRHDASAALAASGADVTVAAIETSEDMRVEVSSDWVLPIGHKASDTRMTLSGLGDGAGALTMDVHLEVDIEPHGQYAPELFPVVQVRGAATTRWARPNPCGGARGARDGVFVSRFPDGTEAVRGQCLAGVGFGTWTWRHRATGKPWMEGGFEGGRGHGRFRLWDEDGRELGSFEMDHGTGVVRHFWSDGTERWRAAFDGGVPHGEFAASFADGAPHLSGAYARGERTGAWREWDASGALVAATLFDPYCRIIDTVAAAGPAQAAGLLPGDVIVRIGDDALERPYPVTSAIQASGGAPVEIRVRRGEITRALRVTPRVTTDTGPIIGVTLVCTRPLGRAS